MAKKIPQFLIAAPNSGSGKTTVCRALMAALVRRGMQVQPYKCGPDYIDTKFHAAVCGRKSVNLDTFMAAPEHVKRLYAHYAHDKDACVVEGMMGFFDGYDRYKGSSYSVAALLNLPVVLVVDARSAAYSVAALLYGFIHFRTDVTIAGVIFNRVGSERHYKMLLDACTDLGVPCLGYMPKDENLEQKSRYLGLDFSQNSTDGILDYMAERAESHIDISRLLTVVERDASAEASPFYIQQREKPNIAVAHDNEAFSFVYAEHIDMLENMGKVIFFSPADNEPVPPCTDLLYLPGGYPEKHAGRLSAAENAKLSVRNYIESGGKALAECGGMMYLTRSLLFDDEPREVAMAGVLPVSVSCRKTDRKLSLGYRRFTYNGIELRGHEFHYTQFADCDDSPAIPPSCAQVFNARGVQMPTPVFRYKNLIASYTHLYWGGIDPMRLFC